MTSASRRRFLSTLGRAGALLATGSWLDSIGYAQASRGPARALIQQPRVAAKLSNEVRVRSSPR